MNYTWIEPKAIDPKVEEELVIYSPVVRMLLSNRGVRTHDEAERYFSPGTEDFLDPFSLFDVRAATERIEEAIGKGEKIFIHGDFDADGLCATALLWDYLYRQRNADVLPYIPSRVDEGYGMSERSLEVISEKGGALVISVDCGVRDADLISKYKRKRGKGKLDFVITDHHHLGGSLPKGIPFVHPLHPDGQYPNPHLSGAGVAWKLVGGMEKLRNPNGFDWGHVSGIDLAGFATVCDIMPLTGENRAIVSTALSLVNTTPRPGIQAMAMEAGISNSLITAYDIGYILGPRINATGRIGDPLDALRLLTTRNKEVAASLAQILGRLNRERQKETDVLLERVREQIEREGTGEHLYFAYGDDWNEGIIGLVAGKLQEQYHKPVVLVTKGKEGAKGSARSINGFNIVEVIGRFQDLLVKYGGHALAAGFTIEPENIEKLGEVLKKHAHEMLTPELLMKELKADVVVDVGDLSWELVEVLKKMEPFGYGNRKPVFLVKDAAIVEVRRMGNGTHLKLQVKGTSGESIEGVFFGGGDRASEVSVGSVVDLMGNLDVNVWNGEERLQLRVIDIKS